MVKTLSDLCFCKILNHANAFEADLIAETMTRQQKEELLKRMTTHHQLTPDNLHFVKSVIFSSRLRKIELHHSSYAQDFMLSCIAESSKNIEYLSIMNCKNITGKFVILNIFLLKFNFTFLKSGYEIIYGIKVIIDIKTLL